MSEQPRVLAELGSELARVARERLGDPEAPSGARRRAPRVSVGAGAVTASVAVTIAIAGFALIALSGRGDTKRAAPAAAPSGLRTLVDELAVLRRPQRASDRLPAAWFPRLGGHVVRRLTRLVDSTPFGFKLYLVVWGPGAPIGTPTQGYTIGLETSGTAGSQTPESLTRRIFPGSFGGPDVPGGELNAEIVPDGITRVKWVFSGLRLPHRQFPPVTIYPTVRDNVALAAVVHNQGLIESATWYGAGSRVIAHENAGQPAAPSTHLVLSADGIGTIRFGASPRRVTTLLSPALGAPDHGYQTTLEECGVDHSITWPILIDPSTGQVLRAEELSEFFRDRKLVGYQYGGDAQPPRGARMEIPATTAAGLAIGDTLATGQRLYGRAFQISTAQGGIWKANTPLGLLRGYASVNPKTSDVSPASRVASIDAGDVGCPALSP
jgi:hypothetical protein